MSKNRIIINPRTNDTIFGEFPLIETRHDVFESGFIYLRWGEHRRANRGFGVSHILIDHDKEIRKAGFNHENDEVRVAHYVAEILQSRAKIYSEFEHPGGNHKPTVVRGLLGTVVLERMRDNENKIIYSVVTAYGLKKPKGTLIGNLL